MRKKAMDHIVAVTKNDKQELATHKVKLNVVDRSQDVIDEIETAIDEAAQDIKKIDNHSCLCCQVLLLTHLQLL